jgi:ferredoxin-NADP reductase
VPKLKVALAGREQIADATYAFRLDLKGQPFSYKAGQTIDLTFPDMPHTDHVGNRRTFSIATSPGKRALFFATRYRGSAFKRSLIEAPLGQELELDGPYGSFTLPVKPAGAVLLAGGIGVTPFRAMVEEVRERSLEHKLTLIHSNRTPEETPFLGELTSWATVIGERFCYVPTMTRAADSKQPWTGEKRRLTAESLRDWLPHGERAASVHYVAGPEGFVHGAAEALKAAGVDEDQIRTEEFPGY